MNQTPTNTLTFDEAIMQCTNTLQSKHNAEDSIVMLLQILGDFYGATSTYIFEFENDTQIFNNTYQWNMEYGIQAVSDLETLPFSTLDYFSADYVECEDGTVLYFDVNHIPDLSISDFFRQLDIENLLLVPIVTKGQTTGLVGMSNVDVTDFDTRLFTCGILFIQESLSKREMHLQLSLLHNLDPLTGFFNKAQYRKKLKALEEKPPENLGIVFIQLTGLKQTSEIYGAKYVDVKIKHASAIMSQFFDFPFYRVDKQKFLCFVPNADEDSFLSALDQLRNEASINRDACFTVGHTWGSGTIDIHQEIANCNSALQQGNGFLDDDVPKQFMSPTECLLLDLEKAIEQGDFVLHLQPKVVLATQEVVGGEALVRRILRKTGKLVPPDTFVPLYEYHAIIRHLDLHVLQQVCIMLSEWKKLGHVFPISVNFSRVTLMQEGVAQVISDICRKYGIAPELVNLEITERIGTNHDDFSTFPVEEFKKLGLQLVLDDFGSTYSNFMTLTQVEIQEVKIDHSLVENIEMNPKNQKILQSIINMCDTMGNTTALAEGIENDAQKELLMQLNCTYGQGFLFSQPLPVDEFYKKYLDIAK